MERALFSALLALLFGAAAAQTLLKVPDSDSVMVSNKTRGLWLYCRLDGVGEGSDGSEEELVRVAGEVAWTHTRPGSEQASPLPEELVKTNDRGWSILDVSDEARASELVGRVGCGLRGQRREWRVLPHFMLEKMHKSDLVVEGEDLKLTCQLRGAAVDDGELTFVWTKLGEFVEGPATSTEGQVIDKNLTESLRNDEVDAHLEVKVLNRKSVLKIEDAVPDDRAIYRCHVSLKRTNGETFEDTTFTLVRIKDKYAALYPFIGIVIEVIVLCLIIFICEKSKSSGDDDDDDDDGPGGASGGAPGNGNSNVRHRRT